MGKPINIFEQRKYKTTAIDIFDIKKMTLKRQSEVF